MSSFSHASKAGITSLPWSSIVNCFNGAPSISMMAVLLGAPEAAAGGGPGSGTGVRPGITNLPSK